MSWYRVVDRAHPLWGLEVCGDLDNDDPVTDGCDEPLLHVLAVRRLDVFVGDRAFQIPRVKGMYLSLEILELSPVQDDVIELDTSSPYGKCLVEGTLAPQKGFLLTYALYERAVTVSLTTDDLIDRDRRKMASETFMGRYVEAQVVDAARSFQGDMVSLRDAIIDGSFFSKRGGD